MRDVIFTPAEASRIGVKHIEDVQKSKHRTMPLLMREVGSYFKPLLPGEICAVQAQTSNYKSGFINFWEHTLARYLEGQGRSDEIIIHIDTETNAEALALQEIAHISGYTAMQLETGNIKDWPKVVQAAVSLSEIDIYRICASLGRDDAPDLYLSNIYRAIKYITDGSLLDRKLTPACIFLDYLQALPIDPEIRKEKKSDQRRLQVREDVYRLRRMATYFQCPVVVGVQAKQSMTGHGGPDMRVPGTYDGEETSSIAQRFDRIISLWMPKTTHTVGTVVRYHNLEFLVEETTLFLKVNKQRGPLPAGRIWRCEIDYLTNHISVA